MKNSAEKYKYIIDMPRHEPNKEKHPRKTHTEGKPLDEVNHYFLKPNSFKININCQRKRGWIISIICERLFDDTFHSGTLARTVKSIISL